MNMTQSPSLPASHHHHWNITLGLLFKKEEGGQRKGKEKEIKGDAMN